MTRKFISAYTPSNTEYSVLQRIFVQRHPLLKQIVNKLERSILTGDKHHIMLIGPRGSGKTHLLTLAYHQLMERADSNPELKDKMRVAWLGEDATFTDLVDIALAMAAALAKQYPAQFAQNYRQLARGTQGNEAARIILDALIRDLGKGTILLVTENMDRTLNNIGEMGQKAWRAFMQEDPRMTTLTSAQQLVEAVSSRNQPFYGFFGIEYLTPLSAENAQELISKIATEQGKTDLLAYLSQPNAKYRIRAIHYLAGGNHRMYVVLSELLSQSTLDNLVGAFESLADELTPYFQERVRALPAQQAKIVEYLCGVSGAANVKTIAEDTFIAETSCSKQLSELRNKKYVQATKNGKETFYEMAEPLMRLCLDVKNQHGNPLKLITQFIRAWFSNADLEKQMSQLSDSRAKLYCEAALRTEPTHSKAINNELNQLINHELELQNFDKAEQLLAELRCQGGNAALEGEVNFRISKSKVLVKMQNWIEAIAEINKLLGVHELPSIISPVILGVRGNIYKEQGQYEAAIADFSNLIESVAHPVGLLARALISRGFCYGKQGNTEAEMLDYSTAIELANAPVELLTNALLNRAICYGEQGNHEAAIVDNSRLIALADVPADLLARALINRAICYGEQGHTKAEIDDYSTAITLTGVPVEQLARALVNRAISYTQHGNTEAAIKDYSAAITLTDAPVEQLAKALINRAISYSEQGNIEAEMVDYSALIALTNAPVEFIAKALINRSFYYGEQGNIEAVIADCNAIIELANLSTPLIVKALGNRGVAHWQLQNYSAANADFAQILTMKDVPYSDKTQALFAIVETMVTTATLAEVCAAQERAFEFGDKSSEGYGGTPDDLLKVVLQLGSIQWLEYIQALLPLYIHYEQIDLLAAGLVKNIGALAKMDLSHSQLDAWNAAWQTAGQELDVLKMPLATLAAAIESIKTKSNRPLLQGLPLEIRQLVTPMLEHLWVSA